MYSKAIYMGVDGYKGFVHGNQYDVHIFTKQCYIWVQYGINVCWYSSMRDLLSDWKFDF